MVADPNLLQKIHEMLMESQFWPPADLANLQRSQLSQLLNHARRHSPFYKDRLAPVFTPDGVDWSRWQEIPIVTRADLRDHHAEMRAAVLPPGHGPVTEHATSGSTGVPVRTVSTGIAATANRAAHLRFLMNQNVNLNGPSAIFGRTMRDGSVMTGTHEKWRWGHDWIMGDAKADYIVINQTLPLVDRLRLLRDHNVRVVFETTNNAELLARANLEQPDPLKLDVVQCFGQSVTSDQRELIANSFGVRPISVYSSNEAGMIGFQCGESQDFHINAEIILVEIVDDRGKPCRVGEEGRVVVTPYFATGLPLIRYDQSDTAVLREPCRCGSSLPLIGAIGGKRDQPLITPNGAFHLGTFFMGCMKIERFALAVQIAQLSPTFIEIRYVPKRDGAEPERERIIELFRREYFAGLEIVFRPMELIPLNANGKLQTVIRLFD